MGQSLDVVGEGVAHGHTAHVHASLDLEEALVSPGVAPGVLDNPVVKSGLGAGTISYGNNSVVDVGGSVLASVRSVNSFTVVSESIDHLEGNRDGAMGEDGVHELNLVSLGDVDGSANDIKGKGVALNSAVVVSSEVRVSILSGNTTGVSDVLEGMGGESTVASVVVEGSSTVNELLLGKGVERSPLNEAVGLKSSNSGEGPARAALGSLRVRLRCGLSSPSGWAHRLRYQY